jgi:lipoyl(octanoyl) transferase
MLLLLAEQSPVITVGRAATPADKASLTTTQLPVVACQRGGRLTWHGTGQLACYPVLPVATGQAVAHVRWCEAWLCATLASYNLTPITQAGLAGVWLPQGHNPALKVASVGVSVKGGWAHHGIALNVLPNPHAFKGFAPCGLPAEVMTTLAQHLPAGSPPPTVAEVAERTVSCLPRYGYTSTPLPWAEALAQLHTLTTPKGEPVTWDEGWLTLLHHHTAQGWAYQLTA